MEDKIQRIRCADWIDTEKKMWFVCPEYNGLFCVNKENSMVKLETIFDKYPIADSRQSGWWYLSVVKSDEKIVCIPARADYIILYSLEEHDIRYITIEQVEDEHNESYVPDNKFYHGCVNGDSVFLFPSTYPAIIQWNLKTDEINYITEWLDKVEANIPQGDNHYYFGDGFVQIKDEIYLPMNCCGVVLVMNLKTLDCQLRYLPCDMDGFEGITQTEEKICLIGRKYNNYYLIFWDYQDDDVDEITIPFYGKSFAWTAFLKPLYYKSKIYLMPITAEHFYVLDLQEMIVKICDKLDQMLLDFPKDIQDFKISYFKQNNNLITFHTWWNYGWHEYNLETGERRDYEMRIEDERYWRYYRNDLCEKMIQDGNMILEGTVTLDSFLEVVSNIHNNIVSKKV